MSNFYIVKNDELYHFGVKGMKWGVRRYQNPDGTLTEEGKKKIHKQYKRNVEIAKNRLYLGNDFRKDNAARKAVDDLNNGLIDSYNKNYDKKLGEKAKGHDYMNDEEYIRGYEKLGDDQFEKRYNELLLRDLKKSKSYKKAKELVDTYSNENFGEFTKNDQAAIREIRQLFMELDSYD